MVKSDARSSTHTGPSAAYPSFAVLDSSVTLAINDTVTLARFAGAMGWVPATSGNFSVRIDDHRCAVSASGGFKGDMTAEQVIVTTIGQAGDPQPAGLSAESPLHLQLYRDDASIGAVAHVHSHAATLISRRFEHRGSLVLEGWELLKALPGVSTHETAVRIPILGNDQDMDRLARMVRERLPSLPAPYGYLIAGHGLYTWGKDVAETRRHLEAFDALFNLQIEEERRS